MIRRYPHVFAGVKYDSKEEQHAVGEEIKKQEKEGKEWYADTLPEAFEEAKELIEKAKERKQVPAPYYKNIVK